MPVDCAGGTSQSTALILAARNGHRACCEALRPAAIRNYNRWKADIGSRSFRSVADQWEHEAKTLREWVIEHMEWMDKELARYKFYTHQAG